MADIPFNTAFFGKPIVVMTSGDVAPPRLGPKGCAPVYRFVGSIPPPVSPVNYVMVIVTT